MKEKTVRIECSDNKGYESRLWLGVTVLWLLTAAASFENGGLLHIPFPGVGTLFCFRILLPATAALFAVWALRYRPRIWGDASTVERWAYVFAAVLVIYGAISIPRAISFGRTFRMLFNLIFDVAFFVLMLQVCRDRELRRKTYRVCLIGLFVLLVLGTYEVFFGGIVNTAYDNYARFAWLGSVFQAPIVFFGNTNDFASVLVFLLSSLTLYGTLWRCDTKSNCVLSVAATAWTYFLLLAAGARLCLLGFWVFCAGLAVYALVKKKDSKRIRVCLCVILSCVILLTLCHWWQGSGFSVPFSESLAEQFFESDEKTGKLELRENGSAGARTRLLIHSFRCFRESWGLGVGLGNTGQLAIRNQVAKLPAGDAYYESIHCFIARLLGDYGVFAAVPMAAIAWLLLRIAWHTLRRGRKTGDREVTGEALLFLTALVLYPIVSTASSDAQDIIPMRFFLAVVIFKSEELSNACGKEWREHCPE